MSVSINYTEYRSCNVLANSSLDPFKIGEGFSGIPSTLISYSVLWVFLVTLFIVATSRGWFRIGLQPVLKKSEKELSVKNVVDEVLQTRMRGLSKLRENMAGYREHWAYVFTYFYKILAFSDEEIQSLAGIDGLQYLRFVRHLMIIVSITMLFSFVLIPINYFGGSSGKGARYSPDTLELGHLSVNNLEPDSYGLWVNLFLSFSIFPISVIVMRKFSKDLYIRDVALEITRTLQIRNIPLTCCNEDLLRKHFTEAYPEFPVKAIKLGYQVHDLHENTKALRAAREAKDYAERRNKNNPGKHMMMKDVPCGRLCSCCCCRTEEVDVVEHFTAEVARLEKAVEDGYVKTLENPIGIAFITFESVNGSKTVYDDFHQGKCLKLASYVSNRVGEWEYRTSFPRTSSVSKELKPEEWNVIFAPIPRDIRWKNLSMEGWWLSIKFWISNLLIIAIMLFFTSPKAIMEYLLVIWDATKLQTPDILQHVLPNALMLGLTFVVPSLIVLTVRKFGYWYRSRENHAIFVRSFWYLWFALIVAETLGQTTGMIFLENFFGFQSQLAVRAENISMSTKLRLECFFPMDAGASFINFVITTALLGTALELLRLPDFLIYFWTLALSRTRAETKEVARVMKYEFLFGEHYARLMVTYFMIIVYSTSSPLITWIGVVYMVLRYFTDKYNLAVVFDPAEFDNKVHKTAINLTILSAVMNLFIKTIFLTARSLSVTSSFGLQEATWSEYPWLAFVSILLLTLTLFFYLAESCAQFLRKIGPIGYVLPIFRDVKDDDVHGVYYPPVLTILTEERKRRNSSS